VVVREHNIYGVACKDYTEFNLHRNRDTNSLLLGLLLLAIITLSRPPQKWPKLSGVGHSKSLHTNYPYAYIRPVTCNAG